ncbi:MAG: VanZ family protein [Actinomycetota bacterium]|nr:VanZ family protein [Actinomycetota bacterium]
MTGNLVRPVENPAREGARGWLITLFLVYLVLLAGIVLWKLEVPYVGAGSLRQVKLIPFAPGAGFGASAPREVVANLVLFVPFGLYLGLLAPSWPWVKIAGAIAGASSALEAAQYILAVGSSDITDVIVNTAGGLVGLSLLVPVRRRLRERTGGVMARVCAIATMFSLLMVGIFVGSSLRYAPISHTDVCFRDGIESC